MPVEDQVFIFENWTWKEQDSLQNLSTPEVCEGGGKGWCLDGSVGSVGGEASVAGSTGGAAAGAVNLSNC